MGAGIGCYSQVYRIPNCEFVIKESFDHPISGCLQASEKRVYERLGYHPRILRYYGEHYWPNGARNGLVFQYQPGGMLKDHLEVVEYQEMRHEWPLQAAQALQHIHSKKVVHCDVRNHNILIQKDGSLVLADFGGSSIDGSPPSVASATRYAWPDAYANIFEEIDDLFALGTLIYEISVGHELYSDKSGRESWQLLPKEQFPDLHSVLASLLPVIRKCWSAGYSSAEDVVSKLQAEPGDHVRGFLVSLVFFLWNSMSVYFSLG
ncbi:kinase-like domain-containing protein [Aspergillus crustosus]